MGVIREFLCNVFLVTYSLMAYLRGALTPYIALRLVQFKLT